MSGLQWIDTETTAPRGAQPNPGGHSPPQPKAQHKPQPKAQRLDPPAPVRTVTATVTPTLIALDSFLVEQVVVRPEQQAEQQAEQQTATAASVAGRRWVGEEAKSWGPTEVEDYVLAQIAERWGGLPTKKPYVLKSIFTSFCKRWEAMAGPIARYAFEIAGGVWHSSPVTAERFCKGSDPYFAEPISQQVEMLVQVSDF